MSSLLWKFNRLRAMGPAEVLWRVQQALRTQAEALGLGQARPSLPQGPGGARWVQDAQPQDPEAYFAEADAILAGRFDVFALRGLELGFPPRWNRDPKTGTEAPLVFGKTLQYRDERMVGNIKYLWEPSRHLELVRLAQAWYLNGDSRYAEGCRVLLDSWFEQCPYPLGPHWTSSLEHAVRLTNWTVAWQLLRTSERPAPIFDGAHGQAFERRWLDSVYCHLHFVAGHFSHHSSANNHLFGEYMGLFIGALNWPMWPECARWREVAAAGIEREGLLQNAPDGVNREQAIWYHHEVADMMLLCGLAARANGCDFSAAWWQRLEAMLEFSAAVIDAGGNVPAIGDADDAVMVRFAPHGTLCVFHSQLASGAVLFGRADFARKAGRIADKSRWLLGHEASAQFEALRAVPGTTRTRRAFPDGGYYVLGSELDTPAEVRIVADVAPLGYLSIAAHGHADALAFTLSAGGLPMLIDPGTYAYHTEKKWRDYFRGTRAHNTIELGGLDQSVPGGNFLWHRHAEARCLAWHASDEADVLEGEHDGYMGRLGLMHRRRLHYAHPARQLRVQDSLHGRSGAAQSLCMAWHFHPDCSITLAHDHLVAQRAHVRLTLRWPSGLAARIATGEESPPAGWYSPEFDQRVPSPTLLVSGSATAGWQGETEISLAFD